MGSDISIPYYSNLQVDSLGIDSLQHCFNKKLFIDHQPVTYQFNSWGYRTHPVNQFTQNPILVLGDSFTLGLGNNVGQRYSDLIEYNLNHQVLNFSLNGASNDWICRKLSQLLKIFKPKAIVLHYTFSHRRERTQTDWHDDERTECDAKYSSEQNYQNWFENYQKITGLTIGILCVHSFICNWHDRPVNYKKLGYNIIEPLPQDDLARDGFHYGPKTHKNLADRITNLLACE